MFPEKNVVATLKVVGKLSTNPNVWSSERMQKLVVTTSNEYQQTRKLMNVLGHRCHKRSGKSLS